MEHAAQMLAACQLGITVCSLLILLVSEPAIHHLLQAPLGAFGWSDGVVAGVAFVITLLIVSFLHVVFGEMVPKNFAFTLPDRAVLLLATPLVWVAKVLSPITAVIGLGRARHRPALRRHAAAGGDERLHARPGRDDRGDSTREGVLEDRTGALEAAFEFTTKKVSDVTVGLDELVTLPEDATPAAVEAAVAKRGYSRYVFVDEDAEPVGYVHVKDVIDLEGEDFEDPIPAKRIRKLASIWNGTDLEDALATKRREGAHIARALRRVRRDDGRALPGGHHRGARGAGGRCDRTRLSRHAGRRRTRGSG